MTQLKSAWCQLFGHSLVGAMSFLAAESVAFPVAAQAEEEGAVAEERKACGQAYEQAQVSRNEGRLVAAKTHLGVCVQDICPEFVHSECRQWLSEVKREVPSIILSVTEASGQELTEATATLDGKPLSGGLDGIAVEVDPGQHELVVTAAGEVVKERVVIRQAEKNRVIVVKMPPKDADADGIVDHLDRCPQVVGDGGDGCPLPSAPPPAPADSIGALHVVAIAALGLGAAGLATGVVYGLEFLEVEEQANKECFDGPARIECESERFLTELEDAQLAANAGFVAGGVGVALAGLLFYLAESESPDQAPETQAVRVNVAPLQNGGAFLSLSGDF